ASPSAVIRFTVGSVSRILNPSIVTPEAERVTSCTGPPGQLVGRQWPPAPEIVVVAAPSRDLRTRALAMSMPGAPATTPPGQRASVAGGRGLGVGAGSGGHRVGGDGGVDPLLDGWLTRAGSTRSVDGVVRHADDGGAERSRREQRAPQDKAPHPRRLLHLTF